MAWGWTMTQKMAGLMLAAALMVPAAPVCARNWVKASSAHFTVFSDADAKTAQAYLLELEQYRYILDGFYGVTPQDDAATQKMNVYFVDGFQDLDQVWHDRPARAEGYVRSCTEGQAMIGLYGLDGTHSGQNIKREAANTSEEPLFYEYAHDFLFQHAGKAYPAWFVRGFSEYYAATRIRGDEALIGKGFSGRVDPLVYNRDFISYEDLLRDTWRPKDGTHYRGTLDYAFHAQSWLLSHYILSDPDRRTSFQTFLEAYRSGKDPVPAFEAAFGIKVKDLNHVLTAYLNTFQARIYRIADMPAPVVTTTALPASADKLLLWDAVARTCPARGAHAALLANIRSEAAKYPGDPFAEDVLARAEITIGDEQKAIDYLKGRVAAHPEDGEAQFMLGHALFLTTARNHIASGETAESQMAAARQALGKAYLIDPLNAANLYYYSRALDVPGRPPSDNMITAAVQAQMLAPAVDPYAIHAATLLVARGRFDDAKTMLAPMASNPSFPEKAAWAQRIIAVIDRQGSQAEVEAALHTPMIRDSGDPTEPPDAQKPAAPPSGQTS